MNWRPPTLPILEEKFGKNGMRVVVARLKDGTMPVLDFFETELSLKDQIALRGRFKGLATQGSAGLPPTMFRWFSQGQPQIEVMGEWSIRGQMGDRILCFRRTLAGVPSCVLTNGFHKPNQKNTPESELNKARQILTEYWELTGAGKRL